MFNWSWSSHSRNDSRLVDESTRNTRDSAVAGVSLVLGVNWSSIRSYGCWSWIRSASDRRLSDDDWWRWWQSWCWIRRNSHGRWWFSDWRLSRWSWIRVELDSWWRWWQSGDLNRWTIFLMWNWWWSIFFMRDLWRSILFMRYNWSGIWLEFFADDWNWQWISFRSWRCWRVWWNDVFFWAVAEKSFTISTK